MLATPSAAALSLWFPGFLVPRGEERVVGAQGAGLQGGLGWGYSGCRVGSCHYRSSQEVGGGTAKKLSHASWAALPALPSNWA